MLTLTLSKKIFDLQIDTGPSQSAQNRTLTTTTETDSSDAIETMINLKVKDETFWASQEEDKSIKDYYLSEVSDNKVYIQIDFSSINEISPDLDYPDELLVNILRPEFFIEAETGRPMSSSGTNQLKVSLV